MGLESRERLLAGRYLEYKCLSAFERVPARSHGPTHASFYCLHRETGPLWNLKRSVARALVGKRVFQYQFAVRFIIGTNGNAQAYVTALCTPLRFADQNPFQVVTVNNDQPADRALASFLLTVH